MIEMLTRMIRRAKQNCHMDTTCDGCGFSRWADCIDRLIADYLVKHGVSVMENKKGSDE